MICLVIRFFWDRSGSVDFFFLWIRWPNGDLYPLSILRYYLKTLSAAESLQIEPWSYPMSYHSSFQLDLAEKDYFWLWFKMFGIFIRFISLKNNAFSSPAYKRLGGFCGWWYGLYFIYALRYVLNSKSECIKV